MKVIILQDSPSSSLNYELILRNLGVQIIAVLNSWQEAAPHIKREVPDFLLVDLFSGSVEIALNFIRTLSSTSIPAIICSGYPNIKDIDESIEAGVKAFITKPIDQRVLIFHVKKLLHELEQQDKLRNYLVITAKRRLIKISFNKIIKIQIDGNYSYVHLNSEKRYVLKLSLKKIMEQLDPKQFLRCHRSTVVNLNYVQSIELTENSIHLNNGMILELGRKYKSSLKAAFISNKLASA